MAWTQAARDAAKLTRAARASGKKTARAGATVSLGAMQHIVKRPKTQSLIVGTNGNNRTVAKGKSLSKRSAASLGYFKKS